MELRIAVESLSFVVVSDCQKTQKEMVQILPKIGEAGRLELF